MNHDELLALAPEVADIARRAGDAILNVYGDDFEVVRKKDDSPVTEADLASHDVIVEALGRLTPGIPV
jgi:3'(2'), 5'-bisphosphate nucleotidase